MFTLRQIVRILDLEQTKESMLPIKWFGLELMVSNASAFLLSIFYIAFYQIRGSFLVFVMTFWGFNIIKKYNNDMIREPSDLINITLLLQ